MKNLSYLLFLILFLSSCNEGEMDFVEEQSLISSKDTINYSSKRNNPDITSIQSSPCYIYGYSCQSISLRRVDCEQAPKMLSCYYYSNCGGSNYPKKSCVNGSTQLTIVNQNFTYYVDGDDDDDVDLAVIINDINSYRYNLATLFSGGVCSIGVSIPVENWTCNWRSYQSISISYYIYH